MSFSASHAVCDGQVRHYHGRYRHDGALEMRIGSGKQYTSIGGSDVWSSWASHKWERYPPTSSYLGKFDNPIPNSTINLMAKLAPNFKVLKSCVSEGICDGKLVEQAQVGP